jgi:hypothetical protein
MFDLLPRLKVRERNRQQLETMRGYIVIGLLVFIALVIINIII